MTKIHFGVLYDFRRMPASQLSMPELYATTLEQIRLVDELGFDTSSGDDPVPSNANLTRFAREVIPQLQASS